MTKLAGFVVCFLFLVVLQAHGQEYPTKVITILTVGSSQFGSPLLSPRLG